LVDARRALGPGDASRARGVGLAAPSAAAAAAEGEDEDEDEDEVGEAATAVVHLSATFPFRRGCCGAAVVAAKPSASLLADDSIAPAGVPATALAAIPGEAV
jgi:hypothetical protein